VQRTPRAKPHQQAPSTSALASPERVEVVVGGIGNLRDD
jgi:hypothetical protein